MGLMTILTAVFAPVSIFKNLNRSAQMRAADRIFFQMRVENFLSLSTTDPKFGKVFKMLKADLVHIIKR